MSDGPLAPGHENEIRMRVEKALLLGDTISAMDAGYLLIAIDALRDRAENIEKMKIDAVREQVKKTIASSLITNGAGVVWDETVCAKVAKQGPLSLVAYAQMHIGNTLWMQAQGTHN